MKKLNVFFDILKIAINENIYEEFTEVYEKEEYSKLSEEMVDILPTIFEEFNIFPNPISDLTCRECTFAVEMAKEGYDVTGVDMAYLFLKNIINMYQNFYYPKKHSFTSSSSSKLSISFKFISNSRYYLIHNNSMKSPLLSLPLS